ncbi:MAG: hypothetical protein EHM55_01495 [Acidobacteria bacterium]|nr:MAG: hypothetical protein EHM55_01495 [Acidobacteriota bacterium]
MLVSADGRTVVSNLGWVDRGRLWLFDVGVRHERVIDLGQATHLSLHLGSDDHFAVAHHYDGSRFEITVHHFSRIEVPIARAVVDTDGARLTGDSSAWACVPTNYTGYITSRAWKDFCLVRIEPAELRIEVERFGWYDESYDKGYQGVTGVTEIPGRTELLVSVQRSSRLVIYDPIARTKAGDVKLAGRGGNPTLFFRRRANELWADDYDTLLKLEPGSWRTLASRRMQRRWLGSRQFIGQFWFDHEESVCLVARPFSGDIVALDPRTLRTVATCTTQAQPLEAVLVGEANVIARDWKSGTLIAGRVS